MSWAKNEGEAKSCKFSRQDLNLMAAQNLNAAPKFPPEGEMLRPNHFTYGRKFCDKKNMFRQSATTRVTATAVN